MKLRVFLGDPAFHMQQCGRQNNYRLNLQMKIQGHGKSERRLKMDLFFVLFNTIPEFLVKSFPNVYIDVSGLPPKNLLNYFPSMKKFCHKYLFGTDFPGVPGIKKNFDALSQLMQDDAIMERIGFQNAYDLFGFWK